MFLKTNFYCLFVISFIFISCSPSSKLEQALEYAGENRAELEKVLEHYSKNKNDQLKYKAACFLIENMPYHNSQENKQLDSIIAEIHMLAVNLYKKLYNVSHYRAATIATDSIVKIYGKLSSFDYKVVNDAQTVKSEFLINNIELAFKVWEEVPWGSQISFQQFCEDILPYRVGNEPIQEWRDTFYKHYKYIIEELPEGAGYLEACNILYDTLQSHTWYAVDDLGTPYLGAKTMFNNRLGSCKDKAAFTIYAMRAIGIPGHLDIILQNPEKMYMYHYWNHINDYEDNPVEFLIGDVNLRPVKGSTDTSRKKGVVYRLCFNVQENSIPVRFANIDIPGRLRNIFLKDVSSEYFPSSHIEIPIHKNNKKDDILYLCLFNNQDWIPVIGSKIKDNKAVFKGLEPGIVYLPAFYSNKRIMPVSTPFLLNQDNHIHYFEPDINKTRKVILERKHPLPSALMFLRRLLVGGQFQGANNSDFSDAETFYLVKEHFDLRKVDIKLNTPQRYRYVRYLSANDAYCNMAELKFYTGHREELAGEIIGTDGSWNQNPTITKYAVFDDDPLTYFAAPIASGGWVGMDFGKPRLLSEVSFQFRNDDNLIREGELYELFYITKAGPVSLGKKTGSDSQFIEYDNVPQNALLWLRNHTKGREERIFSYENGKQIWW